MSLARRDRQVQALVQLLKALTHKQLVDVLAGVGATLDGPTKRNGKPCLTCGLPYPLHVARWGDDHDFDRPQEATS